MRIFYLTLCNFRRRKEDREPKVAGPEFRNNIIYFVLSLRRKQVTKMRFTLGILYMPVCVFILRTYVSSASAKRRATALWCTTTYNGNFANISAMRTVEYFADDSIWRMWILSDDDEVFVGKSECVWSLLYRLKEISS